MFSKLHENRIGNLMKFKFGGDQEENKNGTWG
jgi:hypothetical protein